MATVADREAVTTAAPTRVVTPPGPVHTPDLVRAVSALHAAFRSAALPLDLSGAGALRAERARVLEQGEDYVLPRLTGLDAPALVVVGGPTGAGKSTLVNSLVGRKVTTPGLLRPTTRSPVLVHHPADREWFGPDRILPALDRVDEPTTGQQAIQLVAVATVPRGLAILDAPDFDSIDDGNRELATKLLAAADVLLFVTSAARYSDQVPWQQLTLALERETAVAVVMNRIPTEDRPTVSPDLIRMLRPRGVGADRVFFVEQGRVDDDGRLPPAAVDDVRTWLDALAVDVGARSALVEQTLGGAVRRAVLVAGPVADAAGQQVEAVGELLTVADRVYADVAASLRCALTDGTLVCGDLLAQWRAFGALCERPAVAEPELRTAVDRLGLALDLSLETLVVDHAERAASRASKELAASVHGRALLDWSAEDLSRPGRRLATRARTAIRAWRQRVDVAVAVQAVSGPAGDSVRGLVADARSGATQTLAALLAEERDRYLQPVLDWSLAPDAPRRLRAAASDAARALAFHQTGGGTT